LSDKDLIDAKTKKILMQIFSISNRAIMGEEIADKYIAYIKNMLPYLQDRDKAEA